MKLCKSFAAQIILLAFILPSAQAQSIELVKDINTTGTGLSSYPYDFTIANGKLFFIAAGDAGAFGLWVTEGAGANTKMLTPPTVPLSNVQDIIAYNNKIYFSFNNGDNNYELWVSDGTATGTKLFKELYPGSTGSFPQAFTVCNNKLFFMAGSTDGERRLYVSDGTTAGTVIIKNTVTSLFNGVPDFPVLNNDIYFVSDNGTGTGSGIWKSDGTAAGTKLVKSNIIPTLPGNYAVLKNKIYFNASDDVNGGELWVSDGTETGTHIVINLKPDGVGIYGNGSPFNMLVYKDKLYFSASDDAHGAELFVSDGTAAGTKLVKDIAPGTDGSTPFSSVLFDGLLYFSCGGSIGGLWKTDGTEAGTVLVKPELYYPKVAAVWDGKLYLIYGDGILTGALWQSDGTTDGTKWIQLQNTKNFVSSSSSDNKFKAYNGELYLSASCEGVTIGYELAKLTTGTLPLHLISFSGEVEKDKDVLKWITSGEVNTDHFVVQQSLNGSAFSPLATVKAAVNNPGTATYSYIQSSNRNPGGFYRLQMTDKDGKFTYSPVIKLNRFAGNLVTAFFNSANKQITIRNNTQANCNWTLLSLNGSIIKQGLSADAVINIHTAGIAAGTYIVLCKSLQQTASTRVVIF